MKRYAALFLSLLALLIFVSCEKETLLSVDPTSINISDAGGSSTVSLTANKPWTASSNQSWCKVSPSSGEEATSSRITISCDPNTTYDARNATVTFTCAELTKQVSITQATNNGLLVNQTSYELTKAAQQLNIEVKANVKFSVEVDSGCKDWVKYNTTKALTTSTVVLDIAENKSYDGREGKVTIKQDGGSLSSTVTIKQSQLDGLFLTTSEYNLSNEKHTLTVEVSTNVEFDVKPEADWVKYVQTKGLSTKQIVLEVAENDTYDQRETKVNVKQKNGDLSGTITIKQDEKYGFVLSKTEFNLTNEAQNIDVEVKYNVDFEVVIPDGCKEWIKLVTTKSLNTKNYTFSIAKNGTYDNREGSITFKQKKGDLSATVAIKQAQTDYLEVAKKEYSVDIPATNIIIDVATNVDFTVSISESAKDWLTHVETKGLSKKQVVIAVSAGNDDTDRTGTVTLSSGKLSRTVTINQSAYANKIIQFADERLKAKLVAAFDTNNDGELSIKEARAARSIEGVFAAVKTYKSFDEFQYFTGITEIPADMFSEWNLLTSIILPESIKIIGKNAFYKCTKLTSFSFPANLEKIGFNSFEGCSGLTSIAIPESVTSIGSCAFRYCTSLSTVESLGTITSLSPSLFAGCTELKSIIIPDGVTEICNQVFRDCSSLETVNIPNSVKYINEAVFFRCTSLKNIVIPESVTRIRWQSFVECTSLTSIEIPESVTDFGVQSSNTTAPGEVFRDCVNLVDVILHEGISIIPNGTFSGCKKLNSITIPSSVKIIGENAFKDCISLSSIIIPESVTSMRFSFVGCTSLTSVAIPESVSDMRSAFKGCTKLSSVTIPESATIIEGAFEGCTSLVSITIPGSVKDIGFWTFKDSGLESVIIEYGVENTGMGAFTSCSKLMSISMPESLTTIGSSAFIFCTALSSVTIPKSVVTIGSDAFVDCNNLTSITLLSETPPTLDGSSWSSWFPYTNIFYVPKNSVDAYKSAPKWSDYASRIQAIP